jgi:hypothetical protein
MRALQVFFLFFLCFVAPLKVLAASFEFDYKSNCTTDGFLEKFPTSICATFEEVPKNV